MSTKQVNTEALIEILAKYKIEIDYKTAEKVSEDFQGHLDIMSEMDSYSVVSYTPKVDTASLNRIKELEAEIEVYKNSVRERKNTSHVYTENGRVYYDL